MKTPKILLAILLLYSCNESDSSENDSNVFTGSYKIISYKSDVAVDLNNDKTTSNNLINEINDYNFNSHYALQVAPTKYTTNNQEKIVSLFLPKTEISFKNSLGTKPYVQFAQYGYLTSYKFENNKIYLKENKYVEKAYIDNIESNKNITLSNTIEIIDSIHLKASVQKEYYDFSTNSWKMLNIEIIYEKVAE